MEVRAGYKQTDVGIIPADWEVVNLGQLIKLQGGYSFRSQYFSDIGVPVIRISDIQDGEVTIEKAICHPVFKLTDDFIVKDGDLLVAMSGATTGKVGVFSHPKPAYQNQRVGKFVVRDKTRTSQHFVGQLVRSNQFGSRLSVFLEQGAQPNISGRQIESLVFAAPPTLSEQRAIAAALSDVDALLGGLERLIAKKRNLKQAAMKQLLTGQTRLPGFSGEWEVKRLGDVAPLQRGFDLPDPQLRSGPYPVVYSNGVLNHHANFQVKGPGVVTGRSGTIGKVTYVEEPYWPHNTALWVTSFRNNDPRFVFYLYTRIGFERFASGSGVPTLNRNDVHTFEVGIPPSRDEQTAIATILSDMDAELAALEARRDKTRALKQAMMQELLTGRIRLV